MGWDITVRDAVTHGSSGLRGVGFDVPQGSCVALVGPVGSGKSAVVKVLQGNARLTTGTASIAGLDCWDDAVLLQPQVAVASGSQEMWPQLSVGENLGFLARVVGGVDRERERRYLEVLGLDEASPMASADDACRRCVGLVSALSRPARVFILDDPLRDLSPQRQARVVEIVASVVADGGTVLLTARPEEPSSEVSDTRVMIEGGLTVPTVGERHDGGTGRQSA